MDTVTRVLSENWRFHLGECENAWYKGYDDRSWQKVLVPHDWSVEYPFSEAYSSGTGYLAGGIGWYRLHFYLPDEYRGRSIRIVFDGVYKNSMVWCNSYYLGKRPSGYAAFSYDISKFACFGDQENVVSVKVVHTDIADSRWFTGSGITRKVSLVVEEAVHPVEYGSVFWTDSLEGGERVTCANVCVRHEMVNTGETDVHLQIRTVLRDREDREVSVLEGSMELPHGKNGSILLEGIIKDPALWSPDAPHLYKMKTTCRADGGEAYQVQEEKVGIRVAEFRPDTGFFLNGIRTILKGVCVHDDGGCLGAAMTAEVWQRRLALLKECGCNAVRCSHNPHMPELYALCDAMGFLVMDEAFDEWENAKNKWSTGHNVYPPKHQGYFEDFPQWHEEDLRAMVRRDRNHPSVILWSIGNEIDYPNDPYCHPMFVSMTGNNDAEKPEAERQYDCNKPNMKRLAAIAERLAQIVRSEDNTRPVTLAAAFPELSSHLGFLDALDVVGYNYKEHLYEADHVRFPQKTFLGSENGHSYQAWRAVVDHPFICGQFLWTGIDYLGEAKGWPVHGSPAGLLTTAGFAKPEFYRRKAYWAGKSVLKLATRSAQEKDRWVPMTESWNYPEGTNVQVKCYVNPQEDGSCVALLLNGREAERAYDYGQDGEFVFEIGFEAGILEARYYRADGACLGRCELSTAGAPSHMALCLWQENDILSGEDWETYSGRTGYLYQILLRLVDEQQRLVVSDDREIRVTVEGAGQLAGMDSGDLADSTPFLSQSRKTYHGEMAIYVRRTGDGGIRVALEMNGAREELFLDGERTEYVQRIK